jgi:hypothetical protein
MTQMIGLTLETRPDTISHAEIRRLRRYGCTRVQLGVQHVDDDVLSLINRGATDADTKRALRLLKDAGYKARAASASGSQRQRPRPASPAGSGSHQPQPCSLALARS